jgi:hypothetical protein
MRLPILRRPLWAAFAALLAADAAVAGPKLLAVDRVDTFPAAGFGHTAKTILRDGKGRYMVAATLANGYGAIADAGVALLDSAGAILSERRFNRGGAELVHGATSDGKGGYYLFGITSGIGNPGCPQAWTVTSDFGTATDNPCTQIGVTFVYRAYAMKLDANLDTVWIRTLDSVGFGNVSGFADPQGGLRLLYGSASRDSTCLARFDPQGNPLSTQCLAPSREGTFMGTPLSGGRLMLGGTTYDRGSGITSSWMISCDSSGRPDWTHRGDEFTGANPLFIYPSGDAVISYWRIPAPAMGNGTYGFGILLEARARNGTLSVNRILDPAQLDPATPRFPTPEGLVLYAPYREGIPSGLSASPSLDASGRIEAARAPATLFQSVCFPDSAHLWAGIGDGSTATEPLRLARLRLDEPPHFTDASRARVWRYLEGDTARGLITATDDYLPQGLHIRLLGSIDTALFNPATGEFLWAPPADWNGDSVFRFVATDTLGLSDTLVAPVFFANVNDPVAIETRLFYPPVIFPGEPGPARIPATDADREPLRYVLLAGPAGLGLGDSGQLEWKSRPAPGFYPLAARVLDSASQAEAAFGLWVTDSMFYQSVTSIAREETYQGGFEIGTAVYARSIGARDTIRSIILVSTDYAFPPTYRFEPSFSGPRDPEAEIEVTFYSGFANEGTEVLMNGVPVPARFSPEGPALRFSWRLKDSLEIRTNYGGKGASIKRSAISAAPAVNRARYDALGRLRRAKTAKPGTFAAPAARPASRN